LVISRQKKFENFSWISKVLIWKPSVSMKILFLTIVKIEEINSRGIYTDLMRKFRDEGHELYIVSPSERRNNKATRLIQNRNVSLLIIKILNFHNTNLVEKGLSTLLIEYQFLRAIKKYFARTHFDLVLYSTPPITFTKVVKYIKNRDDAKSYLLLKDIFPQNAVDLGMIRKGGIFHRYFREKERDLYSISDYVGCMSQANVDFIRKHNPQINPDIVEVNPNSIEPVDSCMGPEQKTAIREKYKIAKDKTVFIYGGNLGKPQGIEFLIKVINSQLHKEDAFFVVIGSGTEFAKIKTWFELNQPPNALLIKELPKDEYDSLLQSCDVGMIFLDRNFTIPNFPSRLLSYLEYKMPVIAATDKNTDIGKVMVENGFGMWSEAGD
jgi:glycosyltransferase involved in cell wall biosynthesis